MTVATDLATQVGKIRNMYVKVDGVNAIFWRANSKGAFSPASEIPVYECLAEVNTGGLSIDYSTMKTELSAVEIKFIDFMDTDATWYFSKLFSPFASYNGNLAVLEYADNQRDQLDADATTIQTQDSSELAGSGIAYIGQEAFSYTGISADALTSCTRGLYPAVAKAARTVKRFFSDSSQIQPVISDVPASISGRRVAIYITTWDDATNDWIDEDSAYLYFYGYISDSIQYENGVWSVVCESVIKELDRRIVDNVGVQDIGEYNKRVHIGIGGRRFLLEVYSMGVLMGYREIDALPAGVFRGTLDEVLSYVNDALYTDAWTLPTNIAIIGQPKVHPALSDTDPGIYGYHQFYLDDDGKVSFYCTFPETYRYMTVVLRNPKNEHSDILSLFGFAQSTVIQMQQAQDSGSGSVHFLRTKGVSPAFRSFYPINGGINLDFTGRPALWADQGDYATSKAFIKISGYHAAVDDSGDKFAYFSYDGKDGSGLLDNVRLYYKPDMPLIEFIGKGDFCGSSDVDAPISATQVYIPNQANGPFASLLYPLLSTGTTDYNHATYDKLPIELSVGIPSEVVDIDSFTQVDYTSNESFTRRFYEIKPEPFIETIKRELLLYGYVIVWSSGKLTLKKVSPPEIHTATVTIDNDTIIQNPNIPFNYSFSTIINSYVIKSCYDPSEEKYNKTTVINDANSVNTYNSRGTITIEHPAFLKSNEESIKNIAEYKIVSRFYSTPAPVYTLQIAPTLIASVTPGDVVYVDTAYLPNLIGDGTKSGSHYALVLRVQYNLSTWLGEVELQALPYGLTHARLAPSALVSSWDAVNYRFTLANLEFGVAGDADDGARFLEGDQILVIARAPADPTSLAANEIYGPLTVASDYETDGAGLLTIADTPTLTDFDTDIEYIIAYADYADAATSQRSAAYLGDKDNHLVTTGVKSKRWQ